jgi:hypothetical protein
VPRDDAVGGSPVEGEFSPNSPANPLSFDLRPAGDSKVDRLLRILGIVPPEQATPTRRISLDAPHDVVEGCSCLPTRGHIEQKLTYAGGALPEPCIPPLDAPGYRVHILNPVGRHPVLQSLLDAVERPGARGNAIVNGDAHVDTAQEQFPIALADGWVSGSVPIDHTRLGRHPQFLRGDGERRIDSRFVTVNDDDVGAVTSDQAAQNRARLFQVFPNNLP